MGTICQSIDYQKAFNKGKHEQLIEILNIVEIDNIEKS